MDILLGSNMMKSHMLHFYQLAALDFVDTVQIGLNKPPFCPTYGPGKFRFPKPVTAYLVEQYVRSLTFERWLNQIGAMLGGKFPCHSAYTPGHVTTKCPDPNDGNDPMTQKFNSLMSQILAFVGTPSDFLTAVGAALTALGHWPPVNDGEWQAVMDVVKGANLNTYLFDVVAAAHFYPEYFWIGRCHENFLAYGAYEGGDPGYQAPSTPIIPRPTDNRLFPRGRRHSAVEWVDGVGNPVHRGTAGAIPNPNYTWRPINPKAKGAGKIIECVTKSWYNDYAGGKTWRHPWKGGTSPNFNKSGAYTYAKSPRYKDNVDGIIRPYEVGPLSRMVVRGLYHAEILRDLGYTATPVYIGGDPALGAGPYQTQNRPIDNPANWLGIGAPGPGDDPLTLDPPNGYVADSTLDRHAARAVETWLIGSKMTTWFNNLNPSQKVCKTRKMPKKRFGYGLTEAPRGALGHWIQIGMKGKPNWDKKIYRYQCVVPTTWNVSPRDALGNPGPIEQSLMRTGTVADPNEPVEILRVARSFDVCVACTVHLVTPSGEKKKFIIHSGA